jgi:hypothetical protein
MFLIVLLSQFKSNVHIAIRYVASDTAASLLALDKEIAGTHAITVK